MAGARRYRDTVEDSVSVREGRQGIGIGSALLGALVTDAREAGHHVSCLPV
ncbi:GNAT family N-acetyltransferase [Streptomyces sp. DSM 15324]|uniref:GNAT family N-acetyltransferase n=1 Tax=Streptomyces sp. DSM 15324 TaxID=1739111 RepID=UPI000A5EC312|nr:GNAT family N-acetyltransferase [Streptomyces sp. DSM 15324]